MSYPLIQIDNQVREMTEDEYAEYLAITAAPSPYPPAEEPE